MSLPYAAVLTDIYSNEWTFNQGGPVRLQYLDGLEGAEFGFDERKGVAQAGVTTVARNDEPNILSAGVYIDHKAGGTDAVDLLSRWRKANGRGWGLLPNGPLMKLTVLDTGRFQMVRLLRWKNKPEFVKIHDCGRAFDEVEWRSDESWWRSDPYVYTFTSAQFATAKINNDGDEPSWLHFRLTGPITNPKIGILGEQIPLPSLAAGQWLDIETDPDYWEIRDQSGLDRSWIGERWHKQAPAETADIPVSVTGTATTAATRLVVTVPQLYWSAL